MDQGREDNTGRTTNPPKRYSRVPPGFRSAKRLKVVSNENIATEAKMNHSKKQFFPQYDMWWWWWLSSHDNEWWGCIQWPITFQNRFWECTSVGGGACIELNKEDELWWRTLARTIDNMLFSMSTILSVRPDLEEELMRNPHPSIKCLLNAMCCFKRQEFARGKGLWMDKVSNFRNQSSPWDACGTEDAQIMSHLDFLQQHDSTSVCSNDDCPRSVRLRTSRKIILK